MPCRGLFIALLAVLFLHRAAFAGTFGNTNLQTATSTVENRIVMLFATFSGGAGQVLDSITFYVDYASTLSGTHLTKGALYLRSDSTLVSGSVSNEVSTACTCPDAWHSHYVSGLPALTDGTKYMIAAWGGTIAGSASIRIDASTGDSVRYDNETYGTFPSPSIITGAFWDNRATIYANYSAAPVPSSTGRRRKLLQQIGWIPAEGEELRWTGYVDGWPVKLTPEICAAWGI